MERVRPLDVAPHDDPVSALRRWYTSATEELGKEVGHRLALATIDASNTPAVRIVLCREIDDAGQLYFYTNYDSAKGDQLGANPVAAGVFHWAPFGRQLRVSGPTTRTSPEVSDAYWASRPRESQLSALSSHQSHPIETFDELAERRDALRSDHDGRPIPRPANWGGFVIAPTRIEFWQEGEARFHQRLAFVRSNEGWTAHRLAP